MKKIPYGKHSIDESDIDAVNNVLLSDYLTSGPRISNFETSFADEIGSKYAVAVSNGTAALHLCALALGVNSSSKVITTPISFAASSNCILFCGGKIDFVDIDPTSVTLNISELEKKLAQSKKNEFCGIITVNFSGYPTNTEKLRKIADKYGLWIIEDACHSPGASFLDSNNTIQNSGNGNFADLAIFSFHPVKHMTSGEGGMITTNDKDLYKTLLNLRSHGIVKDGSTTLQKDGDWAYDMLSLGYNYRLTDFQAALGISQLKKFSRWLNRRKKIAAMYDKAFENSCVKFLKQGEGINHAYHLYVVRVSNRKKVYNYLKEKNILTQIHYIPIYKLSYYNKIGFAKFYLPNAEKYYEECLSLPIYPALKDNEVNYVISTLLEICN